MVHPDDRARVQEVVAMSARTGEPFTFEHRAVKPDGTVITLHSRGRVVTEPGGRATRMLGIGHDVTERKRAEEERLRAGTRAGGAPRGGRVESVEGLLPGHAVARAAHADQRAARLGAGAEAAGAARRAEGARHRRHPAQRHHSGAAGLRHPRRGPHPQRRAQHRGAADADPGDRRRRPRHHAAGDRREADRGRLRHSRRA